MARTDEAAVRGIIATDCALPLAPFIRTATHLTDYVASKDTDSILSTGLLAEIEAYLAAHFYAHRHQLLQSKGTQGASGTFQGQTGMILKSTQYGQTAMLLDVTGTLAQLSADAEAGTKRRATLDWAGTANQSGDVYSGL